MKLTDVVNYELIYDCAAFKVIKERWPWAEQKDARDEIHPDRIAVKIPGVTYRDFYQHALDNGYSEVSLSFQINLYRTKEFPAFAELLNNWLERWEHNRKVAWEREKMEMFMLNDD